MYNSSKNWIRVGLLTMGLAVPFVAATAQTLPYQDPPGTQKTCDANGVTDVVNPAFNGSIPHNGAGTFTTIANTATGTILRANNVEGSGFDPQLGDVVWSADIARTDAAGLVTTITADQPGAAFPATGRFEFYARLSAGDVVYESTTPVVMTATLNRWPHDHAQYTSVGPVVYAQVGNPQNTVQTPMMNATVTAQAVAQSAPYQEAVGTKKTCDANGTTDIQNGPVVDVVPHAGAGTFLTVGNSDLPTASTKLEATEVRGTGVHPTLGEVEWVADIARTNAAGLHTTITADQPGEAFPATGRFEFYAKLIVKAEDDGVYESTTPVVMTAKLQQWPHNNANYVSEGTVIYRNVNDPSRTVTTPVMMANVTAQNQ